MYLQSNFLKGFLCSEANRIREREREKKIERKKERKKERERGGGGGSWQAAEWRGYIIRKATEVFFLEKYRQRFFPVQHHPFCIAARRRREAAIESASGQMKLVFCPPSWYQIHRSFPFSDFVILQAAAVIPACLDGRR
jgi:hypothetical protein